MKNNNTHPARSAEFLSRLHDGELTAAERAHFESHRAHCAECRKAALEFEAALSLFRASTTSPPPPDLSARILRRLQAASPRRPPFGVVFGINLKWASAFAVAILATIAGSLVVIQRESARTVTARQEPIPVLLQKGRRQAEVRESDAAAPPRERMNNAPSRKEAVPTAVPAQERYAEAPPPAVAASSEGKAQPPARRAPEPSAPRAARALDATASPLLRSAEHSGGEGALSATAASAEPGSPARPFLIALDGQGSAPEIITPGAAELLADLRGREYFLLVEASGRVREARPDGKKRQPARLKSRDVVEEAAPQVVRDLRFQATDRPRRLLLRIE
jgi:hypothetical protein